MKSYAMRRAEETKPNKTDKIEDLRIALLELREYHITLLRSASGEYANYITGKIEIINFVFDKMGWKK